MSAGLRWAPGGAACAVPGGTDLTRAAAAIEAEAQAVVEAGRALAGQLADEARRGAEDLRARAEGELGEALAALGDEGARALADRREGAAAAHRGALAALADLPEERVTAAVERVLGALGGGGGR